MNDLVNIANGFLTAFLLLSKD